MLLSTSTLNELDYQMLFVNKIASSYILNIKYKLNQTQSCLDSYLNQSCDSFNLNSALALL